MGFGGRGFDINRPHGSLYYGVGDSALNASPYSLTGQPTEKPGYLQNSFGGSVGGPLNIPHILSRRQQNIFLHQLQRQARGKSFRSVFDGADTAGAAGKFLPDDIHARERKPDDRYRFSIRRRIPLMLTPRFRKSIRRRGIAAIYSAAEPAGELSELSLRHLRQQRQRRPEHAPESHLWRGASCAGAAAAGRSGPRNNLTFGFHYHGSGSVNLTNPFPSVGGNTSCPQL